MLLCLKNHQYFARQIGELTEAFSRGRYSQLWLNLLERERDLYGPVVQMACCAELLPAFAANAERVGAMTAVMEVGGE